MVIFANPKRNDLNSYEELTTSKEELQSLNEELMSVNAELQTKNDELVRASTDMENLLNSTDIATLFLDNDLTIRRFTTQATRIFKLIPSDIGRPITDIVSNLLLPDLQGTVREVQQTLVPKELQIPSKNHHWFSLRIMPYRTFTNIIDGVVITFWDTTAYKELETSCFENHMRFTSVLEFMPVGILVYDEKGKIAFANARAEKTLGLSRDIITQRANHDPAWKMTDVDEKVLSDDKLPFKRVMISGKPVNNLSVSMEHADGHRVFVSLSAFPLNNAQGGISGVVVTLSDPTPPPAGSRGEYFGAPSRPQRRHSR